MGKYFHRNFSRVGSLPHPQKCSRIIRCIKSFDIQLKGSCQLQVRVNKSYKPEAISRFFLDLAAAQLLSTYFDFLAFYCFLWDFVSFCILFVDAVCQDNGRDLFCGALVFVCHLFFFTSNFNIANYADDNTSFSSK